VILSRAAVRITLGGGGTDLASFYERFGGFLIAATIDRYVFISANKRFYDSIRLSYSETEIVNSVDEIKHNIFREALRLLGFENGIELVSIADVPANCGLGTSCAFTVSLLNALHAYKREFVTQRHLAEEACHIEIGVLKEPIGKQDMFASAYGGVTCFTFERDGNVIVEPIRMSDETMEQLESRLMLFHTGVERSASEILSVQNQKTKDNDAQVVESLKRIKEIGLESRKVLESGDLDAFGELLDVHWRTKRNLSDKVSDPHMDECYELAIRKGALGGKLIGAGGAGFFMFYCRDVDKLRLSNAMREAGLKPMRFNFDFEGAKILVNMKRF
jgi:D-glycero-alpha-D-manno-heptose-7-phosphate kinase